MRHAERLGVVLQPLVRVGCALSALCLTVLLGVTACGHRVPKELQGFSHLAGDTFYRLVTLGTGERQAQSGDYITVLLRYSTSGDSLFFEGGRRFQLERPKYEGSIDDCLRGLHEGDSAIFMLEIGRAHV